MSGKPRVVVTRKIPAPVEEELTRLFDVQLNREDRPLDAAGLQDVLRTADGILPTVTDKLTAEEVGAAAAFLSSPMAAGITGSTVYVDKGYHAMGMAVPPA